MSRTKKQHHVNHERWMVSYADFVTLLFAFFVVMFASSQRDHKKTQQAEYSIRTAFQTMGIFPPYKATGFERGRRGPFPSRSQWKAILHRWRWR